MTSKKAKYIPGVHLNIKIDDYFNFIEQQEVKKAKQKEGIVKFDRRKTKPSPAEALIIKALNKLKIKYKREHIFKACFNPVTGCVLYFDFYLHTRKTCIEYDGNQHFENENSEELDNQKYRDNIKNKYCIDKKIRLIRLSKKDYHSIYEILRKKLKK
jgi:very-short-patch-repair endonuclease